MILYGVDGDIIPDLLVFFPIEKTKPSMHGSQIGKAKRNTVMLGLLNCPVTASFKHQTFEPGRSLSISSTHRFIVVAATTIILFGLLRRKVPFQTYAALNTAQYLCRKYLLRLTLFD